MFKHGPKTSAAPSKGALRPETTEPKTMSVDLERRERTRDQAVFMTMAKDMPPGRLPMDGKVRRMLRFFVLLDIVLRLDHRHL